jgi:hypothetical protein
MKSVNNQKKLILSACGQRNLLILKEKFIVVILLLRRKQKSWKWFCKGLKSGWANGLWHCKVLDLGKNWRQESGRDKIPCYSILGNWKIMQIKIRARMPGLESCGGVRCGSGEKVNMGKLFFVQLMGVVGRAWGRVRVRLGNWERKICATGYLLRSTPWLTRQTWFDVPSKTWDTSKSLIPFCGELVSKYRRFQFYSDSGRNLSPPIPVRRRPADKTL